MSKLPRSHYSKCPVCEQDVDNDTKLAAAHELLREAMNYAEHDIDCVLRSDISKGCDCGLNDLDWRIDALTNQHAPAAPAAEPTLGERLRTKGFAEVPSAPKRTPAAGPVAIPDEWIPLTWNAGSRAYSAANGDFVTPQELADRLAAAKERK